MIILIGGLPTTTITRVMDHRGAPRPRNIFPDCGSGMTWYDYGSVLGTWVGTMYERTWLDPQGGGWRRHKILNRHSVIQWRNLLGAFPIMWKKALSDHGKLACGNIVLPLRVAVWCWGQWRHWGGRQHGAESGWRRNTPFARLWLSFWFHRMKSWMVICCRPNTTVQWACSPDVVG